MRVYQFRHLGFLDACASKEPRFYINKKVCQMEYLENEKEIA